MRTLFLNEFASNERNLFEGRMTVIRCDGVPNPQAIRNDLTACELPIAYIDILNRVRILAFPAVFAPDFFFAYKNGQIIISTNLLDLAEHLGTVSFNKSEIDKLVLKSYCAPGKTPLAEVSRFEGYKYYEVKEDGSIRGERLPFEQLSWENDDKCYEDFKSRIDLSIDYWLERHQGRRTHLLLSGGVDSRLIFLSLVKRGVDFQTQSLIYTPTCSIDTLEDVAIARKISQLAGIPHHITEVNIDSLGASYMDPVIEEMPCCAHTTVGFKVPIDSFARPGDVIWTGQNMDSLYNMGATKRFALDKHSIAQLFKRWYLSEGFAKTLPDVNESTGPIAYLFSRLGLAIFKKGYHDPTMNLPANAADYLARFAASDDYVVLRPTKHASEPFDSPVSAHELKQMVFEDKLGYLRGGDAQSIATAARIVGAEVVYPYSTTPMLQYFNSYHLTNKDVRSPKRFVYRYVRELANDINPQLGAFNAQKTEEITEIVKVVDLYEQAKEQLSMRLYREMEDSVQIGTPQELKGRKAWEYGAKVIRLYWIECLKELLCRHGIRVSNLDAAIAAD